MKYLLLRPLIVTLFVGLYLICGHVSITVSSSFWYGSAIGVDLNPDHIPSEFTEPIVWLKAGDNVNSQGNSNWNSGWVNHGTGNDFTKVTQDVFALWNAGAIGQTVTPNHVTFDDDPSSSWFHVINTNGQIHYKYENEDIDLSQYDNLTSIVVAKSGGGGEVHSLGYIWVQKNYWVDEYKRRGHKIDVDDPSSSSYHISMVEFNETGVTYYKNGISTNQLLPSDHCYNNDIACDSDNHNGVGLMIGCRNYPTLVGDHPGAYCGHFLIAEILIFPDDISTSEKKFWHEYLGQKYHASIPWHVTNYIDKYQYGTSSLFVNTNYVHGNVADSHDYTQQGSYRYPFSTIDEALTRFLYQSHSEVTLYLKDGTGYNAPQNNLYISGTNIKIRTYGIGTGRSGEPVTIAPAGSFTHCTGVAQCYSGSNSCDTHDVYNTCDGNGGDSCNVRCEGCTSSSSGYEFVSGPCVVPEDMTCPTSGCPSGAFYYDNTDCVDGVCTLTCEYGPYHSDAGELVDVVNACY